MSFISDVTNEDCMEGMARYPDKYFDLAIVDPPYGIGMDGNANWSGSKHKIKNWDNETPKQEYFNSLLRVSKNQIIWGGNYFLDYLSATRCFLIWDKQNGTNDMSDAELAWASFNTSVRMYRGHIFKGIGNTNYNSIHPTQKPIALYKWILSKYAKQGDKILDTHLGSGSSRIAAYEMGFDFTGFELDKDYFEAQEKRYRNHIAQLKLNL